MATLYRRRHNLLTNTLGATLATTATSITFGSALQEGGSNIATLATDEYLPLTIGSEVVYLSAYTAGATTGTIVRARENTVDPGTTYASGLAVTHAPTKYDATSLLAVKLNTASGNVATTSTTQADIDATNAAITFTAPASGNVLVRVTCTANMSAANQNSFLGLRESTTNLVNSPTGTIYVQGQTLTPLESVISWCAYLTGVSAGVHTYKVSHAVNGGATLTMRGSASAPMTIEVWAAP